MGLFSKFSKAISNVFASKKLDITTLEQLEELLIGADISPVLAMDIVAKLKSKYKVGDIIDERDVKLALADILIPMAKKCEGNFNFTNKPEVILVIGVNGAGKTTTIGKLAKQWTDKGFKTLVGACDTFRSAAVEQLDVWVGRSGAELVCRENCDPSVVAYSTIEKALSENADIVLLDTAGRLQNRTDLMDELSKMERVIKKQIPEAPHEVLLVIDGTTGQNALSQIENFDKIIKITGLVITKMDGSSRGGAIISYAANEKNPVPVLAIGFGEKIEDLKPFNAESYVHNLLDL